MSDKGRGKASLAILIRIFLTTLRIGAFTFGGGYAMIPLMQDAFVRKTGWIAEEDILDVFAVAQSLPGVLAINTSVMICYRIAGLAGGLAAALGITLPSFVILSLITLFYQQFFENRWVAGALRGIRAGVIALMISAIVRLWKPSVKECAALIVFICALALAVLLPSLSPIYIILGAAAAGLILSCFKSRRAKDGDKEAGA